MKRYVIEREIPGLGGLSAQQLVEAARTSNNALEQVGPRVKWEHSYFTEDKTFCVYLAEDVDAIRKHAEISGFPANKVTLVNTIVDPMTAEAA